MQFSPNPTPAQAGAHLSSRRVLPTWHDFLGALRKGLCLTDPWVPAFAGMDADRPGEK
jgi:hypothetical protein